MSEAADNPEDVSGAGEATVAVASPSVGRQLRGAREAAQLSVADVAQTLKFSPRQIEALEADDYAALPGNTIVRGFVRSYGKFLKLDVDRLLHQLDALTPSTPAEVRPPDNMGVASEDNGLRQMNPIVSAAIVLTLAAVLLGLWHFFGPGVQPAANGNGRETVALPPAQAPATPGPAEAVPVQPPAATAEAPVPQAASPEAGGVVAAPPMTAPLHFVFDGRSWLEVTDATKQVIATGENPAGSQLTINGKPPFDIVIGNAPRVKLTYGERAIDLAPHTRADVARFRLE